MLGWCFMPIIVTPYGMGWLIFTRFSEMLCDNGFGRSFQVHWATFFAKIILKKQIYCYGFAPLSRERQNLCSDTTPPCHVFCKIRLWRNLTDLSVFFPLSFCKRIATHHTS